MTTTRRPWIALLLLAIGVVACGGGDGGATAGSGSAAPGGPSGEASAVPSASAGASPSPAASASTAGSGDPASAEPSAGDTFQNPVLERNFADPFVLEHEGTYYAYATGDLTVNIQVSTSTDLVDWSPRSEALPRLPFWQPSSKGLTWAPEVVETSAGFVMHYTGRDVQSGRQCLAVAVAYPTA